MIYNFGIDENSNMIRKIQIVDGDNEAIDLTGYSASFKVWRLPNDQTTLLSITDADPALSLGADGVIDFALTDAQVAVLGWENFYKLDLTDLQGRIIRPLQGKLWVLPDRHNVEGAARRSLGQRQNYGGAVVGLGAATLDVGATAINPDILNIELWAQNRNAEVIYWAEGTSFTSQPGLSDGAALVTGSRVWSDESGNGHNATALTVGQEPVYRNGVATDRMSNDLPVIDFADVGYYSEGDATFDEAGHPDGDDRWVKIGHGLSNNNRVEFTSVGGGPTNFVANTNYWVVNAQLDTFQLSATRGGAPITDTLDSTPTWTLRSHQLSSGLTTGDLAPGVSLPTPYTTLAVYRVDTYYGFGAISDGHDDTNQVALAWPSIPYSSTPNFHTDAGGGASPTEDITMEAFCGPTSLIQVWDSDRLTFVNGKEVVTPAVGLTERNFEGCVLGSRNNVGGQQETLDGWIAFYAIIPGILGSGERAAFAKWANRYGCPDWTSVGNRITSRRSLQRTNGTTGNLNFRDTPPAGSLLLCTMSAAGTSHTDHSIIENPVGGTAWTKIAGRDINTFGSISMWYKIADINQATTIVARSGISEDVATEIRCVEGLNGTLVQTNNAGAGPGTQNTCQFSSNVTEGNYLISGWWFGDATTPPYEAHPGKLTEWSGKWHPETDHEYQVVGSKIAEAGDTTAAGQLRWTNSKGSAWIVAEFS